MAVRIRMKMMGRLHRPFFRVCVTDARSPRDGRVLEEVGHYDPMVPETDARAVLNNERIDYWIGVGATPSDKVSVLIKKYGTKGTHLEEQKAAVGRLASQRRRPTVPTISPDAQAASGKAKKMKPEKGKRGKDKEVAPVTEAVAPVETVATVTEPQSSDCVQVPHVIRRTFAFSRTL